MRNPFALSFAAIAFAGTAAIAAPETDVPMADLLATAAEAGNFSTLLSAVEAAGLGPRLSGHGPFTVFAPTDEAFAAVPRAELERLLGPEGRDDLAALIGAHVVPGRIGSADLAGIDQAAATLAGPPIRLLGETGAPRVEDAELLATDIQATNGVIHVIDRVIMPQG